LEWQYHAPDANLAVAARESFTSYLRASCNGDSDCNSAEIVFGELVANVVRHSPGPIDISMQSDSNGSVVLDVFDTGAAFSVTGSLPAANSTSGRGLYIVALLCRCLSASRTSCGNKVSVVLPVTAL